MDDERECPFCDRPAGLPAGVEPTFQASDLCPGHLAEIEWQCNEEVLVLNVGGYVGESTRREIAYAESLGKRVRWLEPFSSPVARSYASSEPG